MTRLSPRLYITAPADLQTRIKVLAEERGATVSATWRELAELGIARAEHERATLARVRKALEEAGLASPAVIEAVERGAR